MQSAFLTARWEYLVMANYEVNPDALRPMLPEGVELDTFEGKHLVSLVGFMFLRTKVLGLPVPFHRDFEEVNLRFYVRRLEGNTWKRGVVFVKEIVPKWAIAWVANTIYGEPYVRHTMRHCIVQDQALHVDYEWKVANDWYRIGVEADSVVEEIPPSSAEEFILEHYWGYTDRRGNGTQEYGVEHPRWLVHRVASYDIRCDFGKLYGATFADLNKAVPHSVFLAQGSDVLVRWGRSL